MARIHYMLSRLPCHFTWTELEPRNVGRTVEMNIENFEEHSENAKGTEVESYNLMGFYKTQVKSFTEARRYFNKALENTKTDDEKIVCLGCLAWLVSKEELSNSSSQGQILEKFNEVNSILRGRNVEDVPEVMAEKAFSIAFSGFSEDGFQKALVCINAALTRRPDKVMFKLTKVFLMDQLHQVRKKQVQQSDETVNEIKHLWVEIIDVLKTFPDLNRIYGQTLIRYALFLAKINRNDNGDSGEEYAKEAEKVASPNRAVMRNVAKFYINTAGWPRQDFNLQKAESILKEIVHGKTDKAVYKEHSILGQVLLKRYKTKPKEETFLEAEHYLRRAWNINKKFLTPGIDLSRLYTEKYHKTKEISALVEAEKILVREMFPYSKDHDETNTAHFYTTYANFLNTYGSVLASYHKGRATSILNGGMDAGINNDIFRQVAKLLHQYADDRDDTKLRDAGEIFREMYANLEQWQDQNQAIFHQEYGMFLERYSKDLAFYYFVESLKYNKHQRREYSCEPLKKLANEKTERSDREEQRKGYEALEMIERLQ